MSDRATTTLGRIQATDLSDPIFAIHSRKGSPTAGMPPHGLSAEYSVSVGVKGGELPTDAYKRAEQEIHARLTAAKERFLAGDPLAERRGILATLRQKRAELEQAKSQAAASRRAAVQAVAGGQDPKKHETAAIAAEERVHTLEAYVAQLPDEADGERYVALERMKGAIRDELEAIRGEIAERLGAALAALPPDLADVLREVWAAQQLTELLRPRRPHEMTGDPLGAFIDRLSRSLPDGYDGRPRQPSPYSTTQPDGFPPGAAIGGQAPSPRDVAEALGGYIRPPSER